MILLEKGDAYSTLSSKDIEESLLPVLSSLPLENKKVLVIIPDSTRTIPMKLLFNILERALLGKTKKLDFMIALGTHPPMNDEELKRHLGVTYREAEERGIQIFNHRWDKKEELREVGVLSSQEMEEISSFLIKEAVPVTVNKNIFNYDELIIVGPVFPHEVVGFSGGYKYLFPGIAGEEITHKFHWFAALITNPKVIGHKNTPVREILNRAARFIPHPITLISLVMRGEEVCGLFAGDAQEAWSRAADLSSQVNIVYKDKPFSTVISVAPPLYNELWVGGKCMYKLEPVVADGGKLIIYAPHIKEISLTHGKYLREVGYHTRDFFLAQWEKYRHYPGAVLAHSTHVKGIGKYVNGREYPRIEVILATGIPQEVCKEINLGYLDYRTLRPEDFMGREEEGILVVPRAGEMLYKLSDGTVPDIDKL
ncbi:MAG TPA: lactate racemase domain-containing protein [Candidatus Atribacteria bacterium]|nr:lactate racemase domain-containing protein [Candidatus Atribacteria bacterium]